jgi:hypothetical protein
MIMPQCPGCSASYEDTFKFCPHCGRSKPEAPTIQVRFQEERAFNACPVCNRIDQVQKLSSIYAAQTQQTSSSSTTLGSADISAQSDYRNSQRSHIGSGNMTGTMSSIHETTVSALGRTDLAKRLAPPKEVSKPHLKEYKFTGWVDNVIPLLGSLAALTGAVMVGYELGFLLGVVAFFVILFMWVVLMRAIESLIYSGRRRAAKREFEGMQEYYRHELERQEKARTRWSKMYYCYRDDVVFMPGEQDGVEPDKTIQLCYRNI